MRRRAALQAELPTWLERAQLGMLSGAPAADTGLDKLYQVYLWGINFR